MCGGDRTDRADQVILEIDELLTKRMWNPAYPVIRKIGWVGDFLEDNPL